MSPKTDAGAGGRARVTAAVTVLAVTNLAMAALLSAALAGCATTTTGGHSVRRHVFVEEGRASYYARVFDGRRTASGERYDPERMTAAHPTLPFGTWLRVTRADGRAVEVRVNDRCGCGGGRIVDLSRAAARRLDMIRAGTVQVQLEVIEK